MRGMTTRKVLQMARRRRKRTRATSTMLQEKIRKPLQKTIKETSQRRSQKRKKKTHQAMAGMKQGTSTNLKATLLQTAPIVRAPKTLY